MEELKDRILDLVANTRKGTLDRNDIAKKLNLTHALELAEFDRLMDAMEEEALLFRARGNCYMTREQYGAAEGVLHINRYGTGYVDREGNASVMIVPARLNGAMNGDTVVVNIDRKNGSDAYGYVTGSVLHILKRAKTTVIGTYIDTPRGPRFWPDEEVFRGNSISIQEPEGFKPLPGMKVLARIDTYGNPLELTWLKTLGFKDDPGMDLLSVLLDHGIDPEYPEDVMKQAEAMRQSVSDEECEGREDLTSVLTITIDGDDSKDFDDAVSVEVTSEGWKLLVSIADVSHYVTEGSPLDREAAERGTSSYVIDRVVGMLPRQLSNGICSLNPNVVRLTNTCEMNVNTSGIITSFRVYPSYICSDARMTYAKVNAIYDGDQELRTEYAHLLELLEALRDCADSIRAHRVAEGAIDFESDEADIRVDETGKPISVEVKQRGHAERIIEDCMIAANVSVAKLMKEQDIPCIYRIHAEPSEKKLNSYAQMAYMLGHPFNAKNGVSPREIQRYLNSVEHTPEYPVLSFQMLRCMAKAVYDKQCLGHFGLAEQEYLHFTSPIRRYPDLIVHRMLRRYYFEQDYSHRDRDEELVHRYAESSSERERAADNAEYECEDMKKAEYMSTRIGMTAEGVITSVKNFGVYVTLPNTIEGIVRVDSLYDGYYRYDERRLALINDRTKTIYRIGDTITVKVLAASIAARTVEFGVVRAGGGKVKEKAETGKPKHRTRSRAARKAEQYGTPLNVKKRGTSSGKGRNKNGRSKKR
ncbi:MAG: ribonuclease R [Solobacterium sp.]|nr:ribonuclease R [Solobacterium sp.]